MIFYEIQIKLPGKKPLISAAAMPFGNANADLVKGKRIFQGAKFDAAQLHMSTIHSNTV